MSQTVNTKGLVRSLDIQPDEYLLPLFEVVVNAIQSVEDCDGGNKGLIQIQIIRSGQLEVMEDSGEVRYPPILGFKVTDNGQGFISRRYQAFNRAFTDFNIEKGGKGVGRYTVLACFGSMNVQSVFKEDGKLYKRHFKFDVVNDISPEDNLIETSNESVSTQITLSNYLPKFYKHIEILNISPEIIASDIVDHCLLYFMDSKVPTIELRDINNKSIVLNDYFKETIKFDRHREKLKLNDDEELNLDYIRRYDKKVHLLNLCANNRLVQKKSISSSIPSFVNPIRDSENQNFFLSVYATGNYLDEGVNSQRNKFWISEKGDQKTAFESFAVEEIIQRISDQIRDTYSEYLKKSSTERDERVRNFILNPKRPRLAYKHLIDVEGAFDGIASNATNDKIESELHKMSYNLEKKRAKAFERVFAKKRYDKKEFGEIISKLLSEEASFSKGKLADMLIQRKSVIKLFTKYLEWRSDENYMLEEDLHNIIFTMGADSSSMPNGYHNLWLLDERLTFYNYISSDKQLRTNKHIESDSAKEPDLFIYDFPWAYGSKPKNPNATVIFEFKRPGRDMNTKEDKKLDSQILEYYEKLLESKAKDQKGNFLHLENNTPKYGYVICELHKDLIEYNTVWNGFKPTPQGTIFKINPDLNLYIEVMTFQDVLDSVEERHQAFFQSLGIENL